MTPTLGRDHDHPSFRRSCWRGGDPGADARYVLTEVFTDDGNKVVEMLLVLQLRHFRGEIIKTQFNIIQFHVLIPYYINQLDLSEGRNPQVLQLR